MSEVRFKGKWQPDAYKFARGLGFYFVCFSRGSHNIMRHPNGGQITIAGSPSDRRAGDASRKLALRVAEGRQG
ncbi:hypothetical protein SPF06_21310 [Sinomonas sp. JGH33]|uniref:Type II toxin-antitoxin system HicA family toxin n=1 Tax=Sinomonas terricola TaxID=3110330 RepID=A0ABU5TC45_9MICC|nr:hypothetical protein [Sinomonas sp. JGH33]MEA5457263.1 hypothetical protein [Sinomonas sp. JGH33]